MWSFYCYILSIGTTFILGHVIKEYFLGIQRDNSVYFLFPGKIQAFEEELISVTRDRDSFQLKYVSAETALEEAKKQTGKLEELNQKLAEANSTIDLQRHEIAALKVSEVDVFKILSIVDRKVMEVCDIYPYLYRWRASGRVIMRKTSRLSDRVYCRH